VATKHLQGEIAKLSQQFLEDASKSQLEIQSLKATFKSQISELERKVRELTMAAQTNVISSQYQSHDSEGDDGDVKKGNGVEFWKSSSSSSSSYSTSSSSSSSLAQMQELMHR
jgi:hypothetical protein